LRGNRRELDIKRAGYGVRGFIGGIARSHLVAWAKIRVGYEHVAENRSWQSEFVNSTSKKIKIVMKLTFSELTKIGLNLNYFWIIKNGIVCVVGCCDFLLYDKLYDKSDVCWFLDFDGVWLTVYSWISALWHLNYL